MIIWRSRAVTARWWAIDVAPPSPQASKTDLNKGGIRHDKDNKECGMERIRYRKGQYNAGQREACDAMSNLWGVARQRGGV